MDARQLTRIARTVYDRPWAVDSDTFAGLLHGLTLEASLSEESIRTLLARTGPPPSQRSNTTVAVIPISGVITPHADLMSMLFGGTALDTLSAQFYGALDNPAIDAIVLAIDSPGGEVTGVDEFASEVRAARGNGKPIIAHATTAASAAYWIGSNADEVCVTPSGLVGSIGIIGGHQDRSEADAKDGVKTTLITAGKYKGEGNPYQPLTDEARATMQAQADAYYSMFVNSVAKGRRVPVDAVRANYGEGRSVLAADALKAGMVDRIETLNSTIRRAARYAGNSAAAAAHAEDIPIDMQAGPVSDLPFSARLASVSRQVGDLVEHAEKRADMRAKEGRAPFSPEDRQALEALADSLRVVASAPAEPAAQPPTPPAADAAAHARRMRMQAAYALAAVERVIPLD